MTCSVPLNSALRNILVLALACGAAWGCSSDAPSRAPQRGAAALPGGIRTPASTPFTGPRFTGANIVLITIDTLRRDHLAPYGAPFDTPAATRLAREGVVFDNAVSQVPLTLPSH